MVNILIADDNINYAVNLMNYINKKFEHIKVYNIAKDGQETVNILNNKNNIDIILLDYKMPFFNGQEILNKIIDKDKYDNSIIIISGELVDVTSIRKCKMIYSIIFKNIGMDEIIKEIKNVIDYKTSIKIENEYRTKILKEILYLGYDISYKGTQYLIKAINYIATNQDKNIDKLEKDVYPIISAMCNSSIHNIKCRINSATTLMYYNCKIEKLKRYFNFDTDTKPNVKTVINTIINKII